jgi:hypothetical protein
VRVARISLTVALQVALLVGLAGCVWSQDKQDTVEKQTIEVENVTIEPRNAEIGKEITVIASIHNTQDHLVVANLRLRPPSAFAQIVPDAEQILFLEGHARRDVKWRARIVAPGERRLGIGAEVISEGRPMSEPKSDIPAAEKAALLQKWTGTWETPRGFGYGAELVVTFNPSGAVEGRIHWTLRKVPANRPDYAGEEDQKGIEYIWGTYTPQSRSLNLEGYRRDDPRGILALDKYRLTLSDNLGEIRGNTYDHGTWKAAFRLSHR